MKKKLLTILLSVFMTMTSFINVVNAETSISSILPGDFPNSYNDGWKKESNDNIRMYLTDGCLCVCEDGAIISSIKFNINTSLSLNDDVYACSINGFNLQFISNGNINKITISYTGGESDNDINLVKGIFNAPAITIADVLTMSEDLFPTSLQNGWVNPSGSKAYKFSDNLEVPKDYLWDLTTTLTKNSDGNYMFTSGNKTYTFVIESDKLVKINVNGTGNVDEDGDYEPYKFVNEAREVTVGSTGEVSFKTYADYKDDPDNVTVMMQLEGEASPTTLTYDTEYTVETGSTIVKLKGDYVKTLPLGTHTITIGVDGYSSVSQQFKIKSASSPSPSPTPDLDSAPRYSIPNTGVEGTPNNHSLLKISSLSLLAIGTYMVIKKKKDN